MLILEFSFGIQAFCFQIQSFYISVKNPAAIKYQSPFEPIQHDSINK